MRDFRQTSESVRILNLLSNSSVKLNEGIHLTAVVRDAYNNDTSWKVMEDNDYPNKQSYKNDLRANGYAVEGVYDNRDTYIRENSDYPSLDYVKNLLKKEKQYNKEYGKETSTIQKNLENLIAEAEKISLTESTTLQEKASIDWNNYLTPEEVERFLSKDDKTESAEEIVYNKEFRERAKEFKKSKWTKRELVHDLANFYYKGYLREE